MGNSGLDKLIKPVAESNIASKGGKYVRISTEIYAV